MKKIIGLLLAAIASFSLCAMDKSYVVDIVPASQPHRFRDMAIEAVKSHEISRAATYAALSKICTRMDAACIRDDIGHRYERTVGIFRESPNFKQQTGPVYHPFDPEELKLVIECKGFKNIFQQQIQVMAKALVSKNLPQPDWILTNQRIRLSLSAENSYQFRPVSDFFAPQDEWFILRAAVVNEYYNDQELFPAGPPTPIIAQMPRVTRASIDCALQ